METISEEMEKFSGKAYITKEVMEEYEEVRQSGICNMFNISCVEMVSRKADMEELGKIASNREKYSELLMNFGKYMKKYDIKQN